MIVFIKLFIYSTWRHIYNYLKFPALRFNVRIYIYNKINDLTYIYLYLWIFSHNFKTWGI